MRTKVVRFFVFNRYNKHYIIVYTSNLNLILMIRIEKSIFLKKNYFFFRLGQNFSSGANFGAKSLTHGQLTCLRGSPIFLRKNWHFSIITFLTLTFLGILINYNLSPFIWSNSHYFISILSFIFSMISNIIKFCVPYWTDLYRDKIIENNFSTFWEL